MLRQLLLFGEVDTSRALAWEQLAKGASPDEGNGSSQVQDWYRFPNPW